MMQEKIRGYIMAGIGFAMIFINALDYIFKWDRIYAVIGIMGIIFAIIGLGRVKKARREIKK